MASSVEWVDAASADLSPFVETRARRVVFLGLRHGLAQPVRSYLPSRADAPVPIQAHLLL
jgi:hypothetical protein